MPTLNPPPRRRKKKRKPPDVNEPGGGRPGGNPPGTGGKGGGGRRNGGGGGGGGGKGGGGGGGGGGRRRGGGGGQLRRRARRDVMVSLRPELNVIRENMRGARKDTRRAGAQVENIYDALNVALRGLGNQYEQASASNLGQYNQDVAGLMSMIQGQAPGAEQAAEAGFFANVGAGNLGVLSEQALRGEQAILGTREAGVVESAVRRANLQSDLLDYLSGQRASRRDLMRGSSQQILAHLADLRDQQHGFSLAERELALRAKEAGMQAAGDRAIRNMWADQIRDSRRRGGGDRRRRKGNG